MVCKLFLLTLAVMSTFAVADFWTGLKDKIDPDKYEEEEVSFDAPDDKEVDLPAEAEKILKTNCFGCHKANGNKPDQFNATNLKSMKDKKVLVPEKPEDSPIFKTLKEADKDKRMPKNKPALAAADIDIIERWIKDGAKPFPRKKD